MRGWSGALVISMWGAWGHSCMGWAILGAGKRVGDIAVYASGVGACTVDSP